MGNKYTKSVVVLFCICLTVAVLMALINSFTAPVIEKSEIKKVQESLVAVLPNAEADNIKVVDMPSSVSETVTGIYQDSKTGNYAVTVKTKSNYSQGDLTFTLGISGDGKILKMNVTNYQETKPVGEDFFASFVDKDSSLIGVDTVAGVTYSSTAIKNAVADVFDALSALKEAE